MALTPTIDETIIDARYTVNVERSSERTLNDSELEKVGTFVQTLADERASSVMSGAAHSGANESLGRASLDKMDDWYTSSRLSKAQREGKNIGQYNGETDEAFAKRQEGERAKWRKRRELDAGANATYGRWQYSNDKLEKRWVERQDSDLVRQRGNLALQGEAVTGKSPAHEGDKEISKIYRRFWMSGNRQAFLDKIYKYVCNSHASSDTNLEAREYEYPDEGGSIPEFELWKIFRCLVSELVPEKEAWEGIPDHIIANPYTIWHVGKCMFNIITNGRFWDEGSNTLNPVDCGEIFCAFKVNVLQKKYSRNLIKHIIGCLSAADEARFVQQRLLDHFELVFSVFDGTYNSEPEDDTADMSYEQGNTNTLIPKGSTNSEGDVCLNLLKFLPYDSGSTAWRSWSEASKARSDITPVMEPHNTHGIDLRSRVLKFHTSGTSESVAGGDWKGMKKTDTINESSGRIRTQGGTRTRSGGHNILSPYWARLNREQVAQGSKPAKIAVDADGIRADDPYLCSVANKMVDGRDCGEYRMADDSGMCGIFRRHRRGRRNRRNGNGKEAFVDQVCYIIVSLDPYESAV